MFPDRLGFSAADSAAEASHEGNLSRRAFLAAAGGVIFIRRTSAPGTVSSIVYATARRSNGRRKPKMPAFKDELNEQQVWSVVAYVQTLRKK